MNSGIPGCRIALSILCAVSALPHQPQGDWWIGASVPGGSSEPKPQILTRTQQPWFSGMRLLRLGFLATSLGLLCVLRRVGAQCRLSALSMSSMTCDSRLGMGTFVERRWVNRSHPIGGKCSLSFSWPSESLWALHYLNLNHWNQPFTVFSVSQPCWIKQEIAMGTHTSERINRYPDICLKWKPKICCWYLAFVF